ncbi:GtrA family protein [Peptostreptococcus faecalis]|uniref:GtrA family protein n=1 Tax=Peptostreptococcus faecalis TaxID=2045015 RepID=UPI000C7DBB4C|nr:GtrA family protein [Peptostreptococcus faecalis]
MKRLYESILEIYTKYKEIINYIIFGGMTTVVNFVVYFVCIGVFGLHYVTGNVIAWFLSVVFAYVTNRLFVFEKVNSSLFGIIREIILFFGSRLLSGAVETLSLILMVEKIGMSDKISKFIVAIVVVILNYVFSKLFVFKKYDN